LAALKTTRREILLTSFQQSELTAKTHKAILDRHVDISALQYMVAQTTEKYGIICYRKLQFPKAEKDIAELKLFKK
jgi:hypothetical protein